MPDRKDDNSIVKGYNQQIVQDALGFANRGIGAQREAMQQSIGGIESSLFDQMGRMQLQTERDIAQRRMQALRSGMPSSQLAAMELQNIQASQIGAQQMAREYDQMRLDMETQLAGAEDMAAFDMFQTMAQGRTDSQAIDAQKYPSDIGAILEDFMNNPEFEGIERGTLIKMAGTFFGLEEDQLNALAQRFDAQDRGAESSRFKNEAGEYVVPDDLMEGGKTHLPAGSFQLLKDQYETSDAFTLDSSDGAVYGKTASREHFREKYAGSADGTQAKWINDVLGRVAAGSIPEGDIVDMNHGIGTDYYLVTKYGLVPITPTVAGNALQHRMTFQNEGFTVHYSNILGSRTKEGN